MWKEGEIDRVVNLALKQMGKPYAISVPDPKTGKIFQVRGKPDIYNEDPEEFDCSGFARWIIGQGVKTDGRRILLPHGAQEQLAFCKPVGGNPRPLDLGFGDMDLDPKDPRPIDHVIVRLTDTMVIEARGPQKNREYGKVITRPISAWENWKGFMGWWRPPGLYAEAA